MIENNDLWLNIQFYVKFCHMFQVNIRGSHYIVMYNLLPYQYCNGNTKP